MKNIVQQLLTNKIPRPGTKLDSVKAVVIHYTANPGQSALGVIHYWNDETKPIGSAHYVIDDKGDIYQAIPEDEKAYHVGSSGIDKDSGKIYTDYAREVFGEYANNPETMSPNRCSIGIELCPVDADGKHTPETLLSAVELTAYLCKKYNLEPQTKVMRHSDICGESVKVCPKWFVNNVNDWITFRQDVMEQMDEL
jgi:N-acetylmuramoyl-L-alanine amidase